MAACDPSWSGVGHSNSNTKHRQTMNNNIKTGDKFRLGGDCVVYAYYGESERYGSLMYGFSRVDNNELFWLSNDANVYPL